MQFARAFAHKKTRREQPVPKLTTYRVYPHYFYIRSLACVQLLNHDPGSQRSFQLCLEVMLRYPGLGRFNIWWVSFSAMLVLRNGFCHFAE